MAKPPSDQPPEQEILDPEPDHNRPDIMPQEFMLSVMRNPKMPMMTRLQAAKDVAVYLHARLAQITQDVNAGVTIRIEGGLPALPGTNIIMPDDKPPDATHTSTKPKTDDHEK